MRALLVGVVGLGLATGCTGRGESAHEAVPDGAETSMSAGAVDGDVFASAYGAAAEDHADELEAVQSAGVDAVIADPVGAHEVYEALRAVTASAEEELAAITPPDELADEHDRLVNVLGEQVGVLEAAVAASQARDDRALEAQLARYADLLTAWRETHGLLVSRLEDA